MEIFDKSSFNGNAHEYVHRVLRSCTKTVRSPSTSPLVTSQSPANNGRYKLDYMKSLNLQSTVKKKRTIVRRSLSFFEPCYVSPQPTVLQDLTDNAPRAGTKISNQYKTDACQNIMLGKTDACHKILPVLNFKKSLGENLMFSTDDTQCSGVCVHHRIDVSSDVGQRMQQRGGRGKCNASIKQCVVHANPEQFCGLNPPQLDRDLAYGFRARPETYEVTYRIPRSCTFAHVYRATRLQREEFCKAYDMGLSVDSYRLKCKMIKCTVVIRRLADGPSTRWLLPSCVVRLGRRVSVTSVSVANESILGQPCAVVIQRISDDGRENRDRFLADENRCQLPKTIAESNCRTTQNFEVNSIGERKLTSKRDLVKHLSGKKRKLSAPSIGIESIHSLKRTKLLGNRGGELGRPTFKTRKKLQMLDKLTALQNLKSLGRKRSASSTDKRYSSITSVPNRPNFRERWGRVSDEEPKTRQSICYSSVSPHCAPIHDGPNRLEQLDDVEKSRQRIVSKDRASHIQILRKRSLLDKNDLLDESISGITSINMRMRNRLGRFVKGNAEKEKAEGNELIPNNRELQALASTPKKGAVAKTVYTSSHREGGLRHQPSARGDGGINIHEDVRCTNTLTARGDAGIVRPSVKDIRYTTIRAGGDTGNMRSTVKDLRYTTIRQWNKPRKVSRASTTRDRTLPRLIDSWKLKSQRFNLKPPQSSPQLNNQSSYLDMPRLISASFSSPVLDFTPPVTPQSMDCRSGGSERPDSCCSVSVYSETSQEDDVRWEKRSRRRSNRTRSQLLATTE